MKSVRNIKTITTILDVIGLCLAGITALIVIILKAAAANFMSASIDYLENGTFSELTGGFQVIGGVLAFLGSLIAVAVIGILIFAAVVMLAVFAVPAVHGIVLLKNTEKYLEMGVDIYRKHAVRDSVIKLIFNGIPGLCFLYSMIDARNFYAFGIFLYYVVICVMEINVLCKLKTLA